MFMLAAAALGPAVLTLRLAAAVPTAASAAAQPLELGQLVERELASGEEHVYEVRLARGEFLRVGIEQHGVDVISTLFDSSGRQALVVDGPTGDFGLETIWFVADQAGVHRIFVRCFTAAARGRYGIRVLERRGADAADRIRARVCRTASFKAGGPGGREVVAWKRAALEALRQAASLWRAAGEPREESACWIDYSNLSRDLGEIADAFDAAEKGLERATRAGDAQLESKARVDVARLRIVQGKALVSLEIVQPAIAIARRLGDRQSLSDALHTAAWALYTLARFQEALDLDREALSVAESIGDELDQAWAWNGLGNSYAGVGEAVRSLAAFDRAIVLFRRIGGGLTYTLQSAGYLAWKIGADRKALALYEESLPLARAEGDLAGEALARNNIGLALLSLGDLGAARRELTQALALWERTGTAHGRGLSLHNLGRVCEKEGDLEGAQALYRKALAVFQATGDRSGEARVLATMAEAELEAGRPDRALTRIEASLEISDSLGRTLTTPSLRSAFISSRQDAYGIAVDVLARLEAERPGQGYAARAFQASERSRARSLLESVTEARLDLAGELPDDLRRREADLTGRLTAPRPPSVAAAARADEEWDALVAEMRRRTPRYAALRYPEPITWGAARTLLNDTSAIVSFEILKDRTLAFVLTNSGLRIAEVRLTSSQLTELVENCVGLMSRVTAVGWEGLGARLSAELVAPWRSALPSGVRRLVLVPDGVLSALPFEALPDASGSGHPLLDAYAISYAPSVTVLQELARPSAAEGSGVADVLVFAAPVLPAALARRGAEIDGELFDLAPLSDAVAEARAVSRYGGGATVVRIGEDASEGQLKRQPLERFRVLHFATHAVLNSTEPSRSALVLAAPPGEKDDGLFQAREIYGLRLKSDLVVLSACQTARGKILPGEGVQGLAQAFFHAGASSLVASLWDVSDRRTAQLMESFYRRLAAGESKAEALRGAKVDLLRREPGLAPRFWAPFVLLGEPAGTVPLQTPSWWRRLFGG